MTGEEQAAAELADRLLAAHGRLRDPALPPAVRERATRRLIALSDTSKHDVAAAARRLDRLLADLDTETI